MNLEKIPVSIITGFLGSGKTTLISNLLNSDDMQNTALIINEFGEIGIDNLLVKSSVENTLLLENGCVCCSIRGDLSDTIAGLFAQVENKDIPFFDLILIETTGLAQPGPIVQTIHTDISVNNRCRFDKVITVVDTTSVQQQVKLHQEPATQIIQADIIYFSKTDISNTINIDNAHGIITHLNPEAMFTDKITSELLRAPIEINSSQKNCFICVSSSDISDNSNNPIHDHTHNKNFHNHNDNNHLSIFKNWLLKSKEPLDKDAFTNWLSSLYSFYPLSMLRLKGFARFKGMDHDILFQAVGPVFTEIRQAENTLNNNFAVSLVFIFKDLDSADLENSFNIHVKENQ
ncbi:GTP-binding protein [Alphaproteobacteria bacterium]|jgi:G3E family GTPase|nr:GTP-binding protein [Alphaproteobacteria bacterium]MDC3311413.1 GTP-binding protein [Alphaproteobacteria bacterium]